MMDSMQSEATKKMVAEAMEHKKSLISKRSNWDSVWNEIQRLVEPSASSFNSQDSRGDDGDYSEVLDTTATKAADDLADTLHSHLNNTAQKWFSLRVPRKFKEIKGVDQYLEDVRDIMFELVFTNPACKFGTSLHEFYLSFVVFGTAIIYVEKRYDNLLFKPIELTECYIAEGVKGNIDTLYRSYKMEAKNILADFRDSLSDSIIKQMEHKPFEEWDITHAVEPRVIFDKDKMDSKNMPFRSLYILDKGNVLLEESGYKVFPYIVGRWSRRSREIYGRSPSMRSLPDIRMINSMKEVVLMAGQISVFPPFMSMGDSLDISEINISPKSVVQVRNANDRLVPLIEGVNPQIGHALMDPVQQDIRTSFASDLFGKDQKKYMTATEVMDNREKSLWSLSAVVQRLEEEVFKPLIDISLTFLSDKNTQANPIFPALPTGELAGEELVIEYSSPVMKALRLAEFHQLTRLIGMLIGEHGQASPDLVMSIDWRELVKSGFASYEAPLNILVNDDKFNQAKEQMAKNEQQQADSEALQKTASGLKSASEAGATLKATEGGSNANQ